MFLTRGLVLATIAVHMIVSVLQPAIAGPYGPYGSSYYGKQNFSKHNKTYKVLYNESEYEWLSLSIVDLLFQPIPVTFDQEHMENKKFLYLHLSSEFSRVNFTLAQIDFWYCTL